MEQRTCRIPLPAGVSPCAKRFFCLVLVLGLSATSLWAGNPEGDALAGQGSVAAGKGDYAGAIGFFQRAVKADPNEVAYVIGLANAYAQAGEFPQGQRTLESGLMPFRLYRANCTTLFKRETTAPACYPGLFSSMKRSRRRS